MAGGQGRGQPTKYKPEYAEQAKKLAMLGMTDSQIADFYEVTEQTVNNWKKAHPDFFESLKAGKLIPDAEVAASLYERAIGYSHKEDKIFNNSGQAMVVETIKHYPPDPTSMIFWLKNRQPDLWREKQENQTPDIVVQNIMPVPTADSVDDWEKAAQKQQDDLLNA